MLKQSDLKECVTANKRNLNGKKPLVPFKCFWLYGGCLSVQNRKKVLINDKQLILKHFN